MYGSKLALMLLIDRMPTSAHTRYEQIAKKLFPTAFAHLPRMTLNLVQQATEIRTRILWLEQGALRS